MLGVSLDLGSGILDGKSPLYGRLLTYAIFIHGLQVVWYVGAGLAAIGTRHVSFADMWRARKLAPEPAPSDAPVA